MPTINQSLERTNSTKESKFPALEKCPQKKGNVYVFTSNHQKNQILLIEKLQNFDFQMDMKLLHIFLVKVITCKNILLF